MRVKYSKELLEKLVKESLTFTEVITKLGLRVAGGTHSHIKRRIIAYRIDFSHFEKPTKHLSKFGGNNRKQASDILVVDRHPHRREEARFLRRAMIEMGVPYICSDCKNTDVWNGKPITLEVNHKNNNWSDNRIENLEFLCPNCHSQR